MNCPRCKLINPDWALRCDCGYDFELGVVGVPYSDTELDVPQSKGGRAVLKLGIKRVGVFVAVSLGTYLVASIALGITLGAAGVMGPGPDPETVELWASLWTPLGIEESRATGLALEFLLEGLLGGISVIIGLIAGWKVARR